MPGRKSTDTDTQTDRQAGRQVGQASWHLNQINTKLRVGEGSSADWLFELKLAICIGSRFAFKSKAHTHSHTHIDTYSKYLAANLWMQKHSWLELDDSLWVPAWVLCHSLSNAKTSVFVFVCVGDTQDEFNKLSKQWQTRKQQTTITITKRNEMF